MSPRSYSVHTASSITALRRLGRNVEADHLTGRFAAYIEELAATTGTIDYFATSLPTMLLFHTDPDETLRADVRALRAALATLSPAHHEPLEH